jgi:RNase P subunit RPR2
MKPARSTTFNSIPPDSVASLFCLNCDRPLTFMKTIVGGVQPVEEWDQYACRRCGTAYEYRVRTKRLRRI